jgi:hypothetical protein
LSGCHHGTPGGSTISACYPALGRPLPFCSPTAAESVIGFPHCRHRAGDPICVGPKINYNMGGSFSRSRLRLGLDRALRLGLRPGNRLGLAGRTPLALVGFSSSRRSGAGSDLLACFDALLGDGHRLIEARAGVESVITNVAASGWCIAGCGRSSPFAAARCCICRSDRFHQLVYPRTNNQNTLSPCE